MKYRLNYKIHFIEYIYTSLAFQIFKYIKDAVYFLVLMNKSEHSMNIKRLFMVLLKQSSVHILYLFILLDMRLFLCN